jgi:hypothetical protein
MQVLSSSCKSCQFISKLKLIGRIVDCSRKHGTVAFFCGAPNKIITLKSGKGGFPKGMFGQGS